MRASFKMFDREIYLSVPPEKRDPDVPVTDSPGAATE